MGKRGPKKGWKREIQMYDESLQNVPEDVFMARAIRLLILCVFLGLCITVVIAIPYAFLKLIGII